MVKYISMSECPHLPNAPITEALIEICVQLPPDVTVERLKTLHARIKDQFPDQKTRFKVEAQICFREETSQIETAAPKPDGLIFTSTDQERIFQARLDGFTFSRLKPYETWEALAEEALKYWKLYLEFTEPISISRVAVRYINRLELPLPVRDFNEYLKAPPYSPERFAAEHVGIHN